MNYETAKELAEEIVRKIKGIESIILDDWRGIRLIYGGKIVRDCKNQCDKCDLYLLVGPDREDYSEIKKTLRLATEEDKVMYGSHRFLNCKTAEQYIEAFVECFKSFDADAGNVVELIEEEISYVLNFRLLYYNGCWHNIDKEKAMRAEIIKKVREQYRQDKRLRIFDSVLSNLDFKL